MGGKNSTFNNIRNSRDISESDANFRFENLQKSELMDMLSINELNLSIDHATVDLSQEKSAVNDYFDALRWDKCDLNKKQALFVVKDQDICNTPLCRDHAEYEDDTWKINLVKVEYGNYINSISQEVVRSQTIYQYYSKYIEPSKDDSYIQKLYEKTKNIVFELKKRISDMKPRVDLEKLGNLFSFENDVRKCTEKLHSKVGYYIAKSISNTILDKYLEKITHQEEIKLHHEEDKFETESTIENHLTCFDIISMIVLDKRVLMDFEDSFKKRIITNLKQKNQAKKVDEILQKYDPKYMNKSKNTFMLKIDAKERSKKFFK